MKTTEEIVTYSILIKTIITVLGICGSVLAFIYFQHLNSTHSGSLTKEAFSQFENRINESFKQQNMSIQRLENSTLKINDKLDEISYRLKK